MVTEKNESVAGGNESVASGDASLASVCWVTAATLAGLLCFLQLGAMASLLMGRFGFAFVAPITLVATLVGGYWLGRWEGLRGRACWWPVGVTLVLVAGSLLISAFFYDLSFDGQWYHESGVIDIARNWNPLHDPMTTFASNQGDRATCLRYYAKGPWYDEATIFAASGKIELGKCINWLMLAAAFLGTLGAGLSGGWRRGRAFAIAAVVAMNPVAMSEATSYMVDSVMVSSLILAIVATITGLRRPSPAVIAAGVAAAIVCINSKFNGLIYLCFMLAAVMVWCFFKARGRLVRVTYVAGGTLVLGACVWGYNPYVTNTVYMQQPFYPILGSAKHPSEVQQGHDGNEKYETPKNMVGRALPIRFFYSVFSRPSNPPYRDGKVAVLMWPFTARPYDLYAYTFHDPRVAGLGPWFSGCLVLAFALGVWLLIKLDASSRWLLALTAATIIASLLLSKDMWWARYGPQLWLLPILPIVFAFRENAAMLESRLQARLTWVLCGLLICNAGIVAAARLNWDIGATLTLRQQMRAMREAGQESGQEYDFYCRYFDDSLRERLTEANVKIHNLSAAKVANGTELKSVVEGYHWAVQYHVAGEK
jgi:hypothetical protein